MPTCSRSNLRDVRVTSVELYFLPIETRMPIKFGPEVLTSVTCARVRVVVTDRAGRSAAGWGETPLSVQWAWPSGRPYEERHAVLLGFCRRLAQAWKEFGQQGHPIELGHDFQQHVLGSVAAELNAARLGEPMPHLAALVCCSPFDMAVHDAYGQLHGCDVYRTYTAEFMNRDLSEYLEAEPGSGIAFRGGYPAEFLVPDPPTRVVAWHLIGGLDPLGPEDLNGHEPQDGYPVLLHDWIRRDGLTCLKIKLRGTDAAWDYERIVRVGRIALEEEVVWLSADFNCTVTEPDYVNAILDRLRDEHPRIYGMLLYVEQPFPYDLKTHRIDARSVGARKPVFLDESADDWRNIRLGRLLGWSGAALKTCKTQTGALLSLCWAKAHGMPVMVQDLANPMLAQIPHVRLAAHAGTIMGVESNGMQFYPDASRPETQIHPGIYRRRNGSLDLSTLGAKGLGYRVEEILRRLPEPAAKW